MDTKNMIEITGVNLVEFVKKVYELSNPQGMGFLHFQEGKLATGQAENIVDTWKDDNRMAIGMDYVNGRSCKMNVFKENDKLWIFGDWFDHTKDQLEELLKLKDKIA